MAYYKSNELIVQEYLGAHKINPKNVFYERVPARSASLSRWDWDIKNPRAGTLCLPLAFIETTITFDLKDTAGAGTPALDSANGLFWVAKKPGLSIQSSCVTSATIKWSGYNRSIYSQDIVPLLQEMFLGRNGSRLMDYAGGEFDSRNPLTFTQRHGVADQFVAMTTIDDIPYFNRFWKHQVEVLAGNGNNAAQRSISIPFFEPLCLPPFNPFFEFIHQQPENSPFKHNQMIPYLDNAVITMELSKLQTALDFMFDPTAVTTQFVATAVTSPTLVMYWYDAPEHYVFKPMYSLPVWTVENQSESYGAALAALGAQGVSIKNMLLDIIPNLIFVSCSVDKSQATYLGRQRAFTTATEGDSLDFRAKISGIEITAGSKTLVINTQFTLDQMYEMTKRYAKKYDFPWSRYAYQQGGVQFFAFEPKDIGYDLPAGTKSNFKLNVTFTASNNFRRPYPLKSNVQLLYLNRVLHVQSSGVVQEIPMITEPVTAAIGIENALLGGARPLGAVGGGLSGGSVTGGNVLNRDSYRPRIA